MQLKSTLKKNIYFRVDGDEGERSGLGHIYRSLKIYNFLKSKLKNNYNFIFLTKYALGKKILKKNTEAQVIFFNNNFYKKNLSKDDFFIIDTLGIEKKLINFLNKNEINNKISFDELNNKFKSGLIINGIYFAKKLMKKTKTLKVFQGPKYIIIDRKFSKIIKKKRDNIITVSCGGSDKKGFLYSVTKRLLKYNFKKIFVIIGKGVKKNNKINQLFDKKVELIKNQTNLKKYFTKSKFSVVTGGTVMFESIASKTKTIVIENYKHQKYAINFFKKKGNIIYAGNLNKFKSLREFHSIFEKTKDIKLNNIVDGNGLKRSQNIILEYIRK